MKKFVRNIAPKLLPVSLALLAATACKRETCEEEAPDLRFDTLIYKVTTPTDSLILRTRFVDCQGDIGFNDSTGGFDIRTYLFEYIDNEWKRFYPLDSADTVGFFAKIPYSDKVNSDVKLEGQLEQKFGAVKQNSDTIRFETHIFDRAGNKSNVVTTPTFVLP